MSKQLNLKDKSNESVYAAKSMWQIVFSQFLEHRFAVIGVVIIFFFITVAACAPIISYITRLDPNKQNILQRYQPPFSTISFSLDEAETALEKVAVARPDLSEKIKFELQKAEDSIYSAIDFELEDEDFLLSVYEIQNESEDILEALEQTPDPHVQEFLEIIGSYEQFHIFGTDEVGRDVFIRLVYGTRVSIGVGVLVAISAAFLGLLIGCLAGFYGGFVDAFLMRITDSLLSLPLLPVMIVVCAIDIKKIYILDWFLGSGAESIVKLVTVLTVFSWMTVARLVRGSILKLKEEDFVHAAVTLGAKNNMIIITHLVPNVISPLLIAVTVNIGTSILAEASLSFLGLGIQPPIPSWGNMLMNAIDIINQAPTLAVLPGLMILIVVISFNFLGDGLQDAINPRTIRR